MPLPPHSYRPCARSARFCLEFAPPSLSCSAPPPPPFRAGCAQGACIATRGVPPHFRPLAAHWGSPLPGQGTPLYPLAARRKCALICGVPPPPPSPLGYALGDPAAWSGCTPPSPGWVQKSRAAKGAVPPLYPPCWLQVLSARCWAAVEIGRTKYRRAAVEIGRTKYRRSSERIRRIKCLRIYDDLEVI